MGVTLFEALLLEKPFRVPAHVTAPCVAPYLATAEPKQPRRLDPDFPLELEVVISRAMARDPAARFESARDLAIALQQFAMNKTPRKGCQPIGRSAPPVLRGRHRLVRRAPAFVADPPVLEPGAPRR